MRYCFLFLLVLFCFVINSCSKSSILLHKPGHISTIVTSDPWIVIQQFTNVEPVFLVLHPAQKENQKKILQYSAIFQPGTHEQIKLRIPNISSLTGTEIIVVAYLASNSEGVLIYPQTQYVADQNTKIQL